MKKMLALIMMCVAVSAGAQDLALNYSSMAGDNTATTATTGSTVAKTFVFHTYGDIPVAKTTFSEEHYLGGDVTEKWNTFLANYTHEYSVSVGLSNSGYEFVKPAIYNAVKRANKYVRKALKKNVMTQAEAISTMSHILDCANVICFDSNTKSFEDAARQAKTGEDVIRLFEKVELVR